jgi:hypothetical protein
VPMIEYILFGLFFGSFAVGLIATLWASATTSNRHFFGWRNLLLGSWWWAAYTYDQDTSGKRALVLTTRVAGFICVVSLIGILITR